jgi:hypothetical protein
MACVSAESPAPQAVLWSVRAGIRLHGSGRLLTGFFVILGAEAIGDTLAGSVSLPVDAVGVDLQQDSGAVPGAAGDLGRGHPGVRPQRRGGVPQVVGTTAERRPTPAPG